jgi:hypothetical protein
MVFVNDEGMRMPPLAVQMRVIERKVVMGMLKDFRVFARPEA